MLAEARLDQALLDRYPHQLSGGQQQRVALAMAFVCRPALIILDEPTTGLDVTTQAHVLDTLRQMCSSYGVAALYVSHDLAVVGELSGSVAVMYAGRIIEQGPAADIFAYPAHPYTAGLLRAVPSPTRRTRWRASRESRLGPSIVRVVARSLRAARLRSMPAGLRHPLALLSTLIGSFAAYELVRRSVATSRHEF